MFGYVLPDKPNLMIKDYALYRAHYCGLCKTLGRIAGELSRFCTNYDCTFLSIILHNLMDKEPEIRAEGCVLNEFKKKGIVKTNEISEAVAYVTLLLTYHKAADDAIDEGKGKVAKALLSGKRKKAMKRLPEIDEIILTGYESLRKLEVAGEESPDRLAHCFAGMMEEIIVKLSEKDDENVRGFAYQLGRWIYFMDAVDDVEKDAKSGSYNFVLKAYGECADRKQYFEKNAEDLRYLLYSTYNMIVYYYDKWEVRVGEGILSNIVYKGLPAQMERLLKGEEQCQKIRI